MRNLLLCLFAIVSPLFCDGSTPLNPPQIHHVWYKDASNLCLSIELDSDLRFKDTYDTLKLKDGGIGAEIICLPVGESVYFSDDGSPLRDVTLTVLLSYNPSQHLVNYKIVEKSVYEGKPGWFTNNIKTVTSTTSGYISNIKLDTSKAASFFMSPEFSTGYFAFKIDQ